MQIPLNRFLSLSAALAALVVGTTVAPPAPAKVPPLVSASSERTYDVYGRGPYRPQIPRPSSVLGYELGEKHTTFREQEQVITAIADAAKDRVRVVEYGKSTEGRPLRLILISSPENLARLDTLRDRNAKLADPRKLATASEGEQIVTSAPVFTWINECIHGDETASFETGMWTLYTLAASDNPAIVDALQKSVIVLNPVYNPDGHERYVVWYNSVALGSAESGAYEKIIPWALRGRFNHYRFDMNRDKIAQSQNETRAETQAVLTWNPQVYIDQHGQPPVYFFPPNALASNGNADRARVNQWTDVFGKANAQAFDSYGWAYVNRETFDFFYPGYLDLFSTLTGAIGMTYETDGGGVLVRRRDDGTVSTLRDASIHHMESALTTVLTSAANREKLLRSYLAFHQSALTPSSEKMRRVVVLPARDPERLARLADHLKRLGIESTQTAAALTSAASHDYMAPGDTASKRTFPAGALVVDLTQAQGHLARALLDPSTDMEPEFVQEQLRRRTSNAQRNSEEEREGYQFYDTTAWALPLAYGLESYWTEDAPAVTGKPAASVPGGIVRAGTLPPVLYLWAPDRDNAPVLALRLLSEGFRLSTATRPISAGGKLWPRGTIIARPSRNPDMLAARLDALARPLGVTVTALDSAYTNDAQIGVGSDVVATLRRPRIAVATDDGVSQTGYGSVWYYLESEGIPFTAVRLRSLANSDLSRFNVVILPDGGGYESTLGKTGMTALKTWVRGGGALIGLAGGGTWFTGSDAALTTANPVGESGSETDKSDKDSKPKEKPIELPGALFRAHVKTDNFLGWGYPDGIIAVPLQGNTFLTPSKTGTNVVTFAKDDKQPLTLSGFVWPGNTEKLLAGTAYVIDEPTGSGQAILFLDDPTFRAMWPGLDRMFLSGILYGSLGSRDENN